MAHRSTLSRLPPLRFEDGDVVVKLSEDPTEWLLVHSSVVGTAMPVLAPSLKAIWGKPDKVTHPVSGMEVDMYTLALKFVNQTYILEGKQYQIGPNSPFHSTLFTDSVLAAEGWPSTCSLPHHVALAHMAHRMLFAILYRYSITAASLSGYDDVSLDAYIVDTVVYICCYAEYYGCLDRVGPVLLQALMDTGKAFWAQVSQHPETYLLLAIKLQHKKLYFDAYRHFIAEYWDLDGCNTFGISETLDILGIPVDECEHRFCQVIAERNKAIKNMEQDLLRLQLCEYTYSYGAGPRTVHTTFLNKISMRKLTHPHRSDDVKARERYGFLARSIYGQWLAQQLYGQRVYFSGGKDRAERAGSLSVVCRVLQEAAASDDPSRILGFKASSRISSVFRLGWKYDPAKRIKQDLEKIVKDAATIVEQAFATRKNYMRDGEGLVLVTYRRCEYDEQGYYPTYMPLDENEFPWEEESAVVKELLEVDTTPASVAWLKALGLHE